MAAHRVESAAHGYAPQLDGLRAVAVAAVAYSHWLPAWQFGIPLGAGVHLFFVLSGFLITRILLDLRGAADRRAAVGRFYVRRALRLCPAFYLVLGVAAFAGAPLVRETWPWHAAYLSNVYIASEHRWLGHVSHFWSLAVEEQFYVVWPWVVVWSPASRLGIFLAITVLAGPVIRVVAAWNGVAEPFWALVPGGSADSLAIGALLAWAAWRDTPLEVEARSARVAQVACVGACVWIAMAVAESRAPLAAAVAGWRHMAQGAVFGWMVWRASTGVGGVVGRALAHPVLVYLGRISYGTYLIHAFAPRMLQAAVRASGVTRLLPGGDFAHALAYGVTTLVAAAVMWHLVEAPLNARKSRFPYGVGRVHP